MSVQVEKLEKNMAKLTIELSAEQFEDAMKKAFNKSKNKFNIPGFRKGKAPRAMIEKMYGEGIFYEEAADEAINATCMICLLYTSHGKGLCISCGWTGRG